MLYAQSCLGSLWPEGRVRLTAGIQREGQQTLQGWIWTNSLAEGRKGRGFPGLFLKEEEQGLLPGETQQYHLVGSCALWPHLVCPSDDAAWHGLTLTQTTERIWRWRALQTVCSNTFVPQPRPPESTERCGGHRAQWGQARMGSQCPERLGALSFSPVCPRKPKSRQCDAWPPSGARVSSRVCALTPPDSNQSYVQPL